MAEYINRENLAKEGWFLQRHVYSDGYAAIETKKINDIPAADVRPVVLCQDCKHYVLSGETDGERMCVRGAEWCPEVGCYYGFTDYTRPDYFCADGKKREES